MIKTKFDTVDIEHALKLVLGFEKKLEKWAKKNNNAHWHIEIRIGNINCIVIVIVDNEPRNNNKGKLNI